MLIKRSLAVVTLMVYLALLVNCALSPQFGSEIANTLPDDTATSRPTLVASQPSPTLQPSPTTQATLTPTLQLESVVSVSPTHRSTIEPGIPTVVDQLHFDVPIVDALADPTTDRLYLINQQGTLQVLDLANHNEIAQVETGFQMADDHYVGGGELSLDPNRNRLYISIPDRSDNTPIRVMDTKALTVTVHSNLTGQVTPDPTSNRLYLTNACRTQVLDADTWVEIDILLPYGSGEPHPAGNCLISTRLDIRNQILYGYTQACSGSPSCAGTELSIFDVSATPQYISYTYGRAVAFDPSGQCVFVSDYYYKGMVSSISRYDVSNQMISHTLGLSRAGGWWQMFYDPTHDRLYGEDAVFDGNLVLLTHTELPGSLLTFDPKGQHLYSSDEEGNLYIIATGGGQLQLPSSIESVTEQGQTQSLITNDGTRFHLRDGRLYRSDDEGRTWQLSGLGLPDKAINAVAVSSNYEQDKMLLVSISPQEHTGGLYRSVDGGNTWQPSTSGLTSLEITEIVFSPTFSSDQTIFLTILTGGRYYDENLFRSTDGGETWTDTGISEGTIAFSPNFADDRLIISRSYWRSTDGGQTWQPPVIKPDTFFISFRDKFLFSPNFAQDETVYLLKPVYGEEIKISLERSTDAGRTWQSLANEIPVDFEYAAATILDTGELYLTNGDGQDLTIDLASLEWSNPPELTPSSSK